MGESHSSYVDFALVLIFFAADGLDYLISLAFEAIITNRQWTALMNLDFCYHNMNPPYTYII